MINVGISSTVEDLISMINHTIEIVKEVETVNFERSV
jgi:hypothetical protein